MLSITYYQLYYQLLWRGVDLVDAWSTVCGAIHGHALARGQESGEGGSMATSTRRKAPPALQADKVLLAMGALALGQVSTKKEAQKLAGLGNDALMPYRLEKLAEQVPGVREQFATLGTLLEFSVEIDGQAVKMRDALLKVAAASVRALHSNADAGILEGDSKAAQSLRMAKTMLLMCQDCGLWQNDSHNGAPAELEQMRQRQAETMSVESLTQVTVTTFNRDHRRHDGVGPTVKRQREAAQMLAPQTIDAELKPDSPTAEQDSTAS